MNCLRQSCFRILKNGHFKGKPFIRKISVTNYLNNIIHSEFKEVEIPKVSLPTLLESSLSANLNHVAAECGITGRKYTYEDVKRKSKNLGRCLRKIFNLQKGDVIAILLPNCPEYCIAALGSLDAGLVVTTVNPAYTPHEICYQLKDSGAKAIITLCDLHNTAQSSLSLAKKELPIITIKSQTTDQTPSGAVDFTELTENKLDLPDVLVNYDDLAFLPYSSGTTGLPKGVRLTHGNFVANVTQNSSPEIGLVIKATSDYQEVLPAVLPMFHIYGLNILVLGALYCGSKAISLPKFTPEDYINVLSKNNCHLIAAAPPLVLFMTAHPAVKKEYFESTRIITSGAAPLGASDEERFLNKIQRNIHLIQGYGLTECSPVVTSTNPQNKVPGSIGVAIPNTTVKVVAVDDSSGSPLGPNVKGELLVKGPQVMDGYHNNPTETENAFQDGWFKTGDIVYYDENKAFFVTDRLKELIKVKGFQVAPAELEALIRSFPGAAEAGVIGIPDERYGEVPKAFVVPAQGKSVDVKKLNEFINEKVAQHKRLLGGIDIVDSIPKNTTGKILRRKLRDDYLNKAK